MKTDLQFFCPRWGSEHLDWNTLFLRARDAGYEGIEYAIAGSVTNLELDEVWNLAEKYSMKMIAQHYDTNTADFDQHLAAYMAWLHRIAEYPVVRINSQTGKDFFSFEQNAMLIDAAQGFALRTGAAISHETHRGKFSYSAHTTKNYLNWFEQLRLTLDLSHWVNVAESYLQDQQATLAEAIERTDHLHARIGFPEGPQVPVPKAPEWQEALCAHLFFWDQLVALKATLTITPEFGPYPYLLEEPFTRRPLANQWETNVWMMNLLKERYA